jgi:hypothetical protein
MLHGTCASDNSNYSWYAIPCQVFEFCFMFISTIKKISLFNELRVLANTGYVIFLFFSFRPIPNLL